VGKGRRRGRRLLALAAQADAVHPQQLISNLPNGWIDTIERERENERERETRTDR
jgi:hypothetical protein